MTTTETAPKIRPHRQYLDELGRDERELWLNGERITNPLEHPLPHQGQSRSPAFDLQHEHPDEMLMPSPDDGALVNVTHLIPRAKEDLESPARDRDHRGRHRRDDGADARLPQRDLRVLRRARRRVGQARQRAGRREHRRLPEGDADRDSTTHTIINPQVDRSKPEAEQAAGEVALHRVGETSEGIVVRGARMLATLAPFADELTVYPVGHPAPGRRLRAGVRDPDGNARPQVRLPDTFAKSRSHFDYPLRRASTRWTPSRSLTTSSCPGSASSSAETRSAIRRSSPTRAGEAHHAPGVHARHTKLLFAFGLGHLIANTTGVVRFDHIQEKLGQIWNMVELTRSAVVAAEAGSGWTKAGSGIRTTARSSACAARCRSGCRT